MSIQLNVPGSSSSGPAGPVDVYAVLPVSDITTQQGGLNLYQLTLGGMESILLDGTNCDADLLAQFFLQDSPVGQPLLWFLWANQRDLVRFDSPIQYMVLSNATAGHTLPSFMGNFLPYRNPNNTNGFLLIAAQDSMVAVDGITNSVHVGGTITADIPGTVTVGGTVTSEQGGSWDVGPAANFPVVNPANSQLVVSRPYINQGTLNYSAPITAVDVGPVGVATNVTGLAFGNTSGDTITLTVTGQSSGLTYFSAQLSAGQIAITSLPLGGENCHVYVTDGGSGAKSIEWSYIYDTSTLVPQNWGNGALSVTFATGSALTTNPGTAATSASSQQNTPGLTDQVIGSSFAKFSNLWSVSVTMAVESTSFVDYSQSIIALKGTTTGKILPVIGCSCATTQIEAGSPATFVGAGHANLVFPYPIPVSAIFPSDANLEWIARRTTPLATSPGYTVTALTS